MPALLLNTPESVVGSGPISYAVSPLLYNVNTTQGIGSLIRFCLSINGLSEDIHAARMYADYDGVIHRREMT